MTVIYDQMTVVHVQTVTLMLVMDVRDQLGFVASGRSKGVKLDGPNQGSKSRKISYRAFVHDFVRRQNIFRARRNRAT